MGTGKIKKMNKHKLTVRSFQDPAVFFCPIFLRDGHKQPGTHGKNSVIIHTIVSTGLHQGFVLQAPCVPEYRGKEATTI